MGRKQGATPLFGKAARHPVELQHNNVTVDPRCRSIAGDKAGRDFSAGFSIQCQKTLSGWGGQVFASRGHRPSSNIGAIGSASANARHLFQDLLDHPKLESCRTGAIASYVAQKVQPPAIFRRLLTTISDGDGADGDDVVALRDDDVA